MGRVASTYTRGTKEPHTIATTIQAAYRAGQAPKGRPSRAPTGRRGARITSRSLAMAYRWHLVECLRDWTECRAHLGQGHFAKPLRRRWASSRLVIPEGAAPPFELGTGLLPHRSDLRSDTRNARTEGLRGGDEFMFMRVPAVCRR